MAAQLAPLAGPAAKLVSEGCAKAVSRGTGVSAMLLVAQVAAADTGAGVGPGVSAQALLLLNVLCCGLVAVLM